VYNSINLSKCYRLVILIKAFILLKVT
jgi:hypothetical protein